MFGKLKENIQDIREDIKGLLESNIAYYKLWLFKVITKSFSALLKVLMIGIFLVVALAFFSVAAAIAIGEALNSMAYGFLIVGGFYFLLCVIIYVCRRSVEKPIIETFSEIFYNEDD
jgi:predicted membrane channel-forming protein YqfA (hemolysin III family)